MTFKAGLFQVFCFSQPLLIIHCSIHMVAFTVEVECHTVHWNFHFGESRLYWYYAPKTIILSLFEPNQFSLRRRIWRNNVINICSRADATAFANAHLTRSFQHFKSRRAPRIPTNLINSGNKQKFNYEIHETKFLIAQEI